MGPEARWTDICSPHLLFSRTSTHVSRCYRPLGAFAPATGERPMEHGGTARFGGPLPEMGGIVLRSIDQAWPSL